MKWESKTTAKRLRNDDKNAGPSVTKDASVFNDGSFDAPYGKCPIHGRKGCGACKPFYKKEGEWPCWARRGEVQFLWESRKKESGKIGTVKCRIHLKAKVSQVSAF